MSELNQQECPYGPLSDEEKHIIVDKATEPPFSGRYDKFHQFGVYACRRCGAPLYTSAEKFNSGCGWPAFDDAIPGAVMQFPDADGRRIEIVCAQCNAHLGHVFAGENFTQKNTRHCVNSRSLCFEPQDGKNIRRAVFAGGCFWGVEALMKKQPGVLAAVSGYCGGETDFPDYRQVCSGDTGHAEAVEIFYRPELTGFEELCRYFLEIHDPTQHNRQGPDFGTQYRSAIFYLDDAQRQTARELLDILRQKGYEVKTELSPFGRFWNAEAYHQHYYAKNGKEPYCHFYRKLF